MSASVPPADPGVATLVEEPADRALVAVSTFSRLAGSVIALGFLLGLVPGQLAVVVGAVALVTFGRSLAPGTVRTYLGPAAFGVIALAATVGALRWGSSSLDAIRGAQAVLGPTVLIDPREAAIGSGLAAGAGIVAQSLWLSAHRPGGVVSFVSSCAEAVIVALLLATAFWGPAVVAPGAGDAAELAKDVGAWALVVLAASVPAVGLSFLWRRFSAVWSWVALLVAVSAALAGTVLVPSFVAS